MHSFPHYQHPHQSGISVTIDESALTYHYYLSPWFMSVSSFGGLTFMGLDICIMICGASW